MLRIAVHQFKINHRIPWHILAARAGAGGLRIQLKIISAAKCASRAGENNNVNGVIFIGPTDGIIEQGRHLIADGI